ncbi:MAG: hypothetical protein Pg6C_17910 [Treponemataceae bacterium]|jgi:hypothetical protein|nr:MAG: hypothetical protein Pg6C_17910 [Treponemataceae bacterium]
MNKHKARKLDNAKAELEQVNSAITAILSGAQQYSIGSRSVQKANLETLYKRKDSLESLVGALEGGSGRVRQVVSAYK